MSALTLGRTLAATALVAAGGVAAASAATGDGAPASAAALKITPMRAGPVHLGDRYTSLRARGLVRRIGPGCELEENSRAARLKAPLRGTVNFSRRSPRKVDDILVTGGAKARGVGVGSRARAIRRAFPKARFVHSTEPVFGITLVKVPRGGGGRMQFAVSTKTHRVTLIGVPFIAFCE
jgi:hypothetical protein